MFSLQTDSVTSSQIINNSSIYYQQIAEDQLAGNTKVSELWVMTTVKQPKVASYYKVATIEPYQYSVSGNLNITGSIVIGPGYANSGICNFSFTFQPDFLSSIPFISGFAFTETDVPTTNVVDATSGEFMYRPFSATRSNGSIIYGFDIYYFFSGSASENTATFTVTQTGNLWGGGITLYPPTNTGTTIQPTPAPTYILQTINKNGISVFNGSTALGGGGVVFSNNNLLQISANTTNTTTNNLCNSFGYQYSGTTIANTAFPLFSTASTNRVYLVTVNYTASGKADIILLTTPSSGTATFTQIVTQSTGATYTTAGSNPWSLNVTFTVATAFTVSTICLSSS